MRLRPESRKRRGASLVEAVLVLLIFLTFILSMMDLGLGAMRRNVICEAARQGARQAIVHGKLAPSPWGPASGAYPGQNPYTVTADNSSDAIAGAVRPYLATLDPGTVTLRVQRLDGHNDSTLDSRDQVTLSCPYTPMTTLIATFT